MPKRPSIVMSVALMGLVSLSFAASEISTPAQAHEWFHWDRTLPYPNGARDPSDPDVEAATFGHTPVTREIGSYQPVDPSPWGDVNKRVTPIPKPPPQQRKDQ